MQGTPRMRVLVLGGYGNFGAMISRRLAADRRFELIVAGRDAAQAAKFAAALGAASLRLDAGDAALARKLHELAPALVISTAGPFQGRDYGVARACIAAGAHYIDIADGRAFVCGIGALDGEARERGVLAVSGASSVPALSSAVVDHYLPEFTELREIDAGISSSSRLPGAATTAAILGYCGKPIPAFTGGSMRAAIGLQGLRRYRFADPPMTRWLSDCDVPDLQLFPARYPGVATVRFGAGTELAPIQWGLGLVAALVRARLVRDLASWSRPLRGAAKALGRFGTGRSAMFVVMRGIGRDGHPHERRWELRACGEAGSEVPGLAPVLLARKLAAGELPMRGAMPCVGLVSLDEWAGAMAGLRGGQGEPFSVIIQGFPQ